MRRRVRRRGLAAGLCAALLAALVPAAPAAADSARDQQWALGFLDAETAWQTTRGAGVTVAVLDTGIVGSRPDLTGQVTAGPDYVGGSTRPGSATWGEHGTAMASVIAGHGNGPGGADGVVGIAPAAHILSVRVIRDEQEPDYHEPAATGDPLARGIRYAVASGAQVISMSLGGGTGSADEVSAIDDALAHGVAVVASAGNSATSGDTTEFPAAVPGVIAVGAVDQNGDWADFSTHGWDVAVAAPGVSIVTDAPDFGYYKVDGTSPACAYVAGVVALIRSRYPRLSPAQIKLLLERTASHRPPGGRDDYTGFGIVDPVAALAAAASLAPAAATPAPAGYQGAHYFGFGPTVAIYPASAPISDGLRWLLDSVLILVCTVAAGVIALLRGGRKRSRDWPLPPDPPTPAT